jgi:peptidoglycan/xylan/chitin deacetylase (PgdA/CDA1 family)
MKYLNIARMGKKRAMSLFNWDSSTNIYYYHRIGPYTCNFSLQPLDEKIFERQMLFLQKYYEIVSLDTFVKKKHMTGKIPKRTAIVTFDDGYKDNYIYAYPVLKKYNIPATIFLSTECLTSKKILWTDRFGYIVQNTTKTRYSNAKYGSFSLKTPGEKRFFIDRFKNTLLKKVPNNEKLEILNELEEDLGVEIPEDICDQLMMSWDQICEMHENGVFFGAHTVSHPIMSRISMEQARYELEQSKKDIENRLGIKINTFAYPNGGIGDYTTETVNLIRDCGFTCAVTTIPDPVTDSTDLFTLNRKPFG